MARIPSKHTIDLDQMITQIQTGIEGLNPSRMEEGPRMELDHNHLIQTRHSPSSSPSPSVKQMSSIPPTLFQSPEQEQEFEEYTRDTKEILERMDEWTAARKALVTDRLVIKTTSQVFKPRTRKAIFDLPNEGQEIVAISQTKGLHLPAGRSRLVSPPNQAIIRKWSILDYIGPQTHETIQNLQVTSRVELLTSSDYRYDFDVYEQLFTRNPTEQEMILVQSVFQTLGIDLGRKIQNDLFLTLKSPIGIVSDRYLQVQVSETKEKIGPLPLMIQGMLIFPRIQVRRVFDWYMTHVFTIQVLTELVKENQDPGQKKEFTEKLVRVQDLLMSLATKPKEEFIFFIPTQWGLVTESHIEIKDFFVWHQITQKEGISLEQEQGLFEPMLIELNQVNYYRIDGPGGYESQFVQMIQIKDFDQTNQKLRLEEFLNDKDQILSQDFLSQISSKESGIINLLKTGLSKESELETIVSSKDQAKTRTSLRGQNPTIQEIPAKKVIERNKMIGIDRKVTRYDWREQVYVLLEGMTKDEIHKSLLHLDQEGVEKLVYLDPSREITQEVDVHQYHIKEYILGTQLRDKISLSMELIQKIRDMNVYSRRTKTVVILGGYNSLGIMNLEEIITTNENEVLSDDEEDQAIKWIRSKQSDSIPNSTYFVILEGKGLKRVEYVRMNDQNDAHQRELQMSLALRENQNQNQKARVYFGPLFGTRALVDPIGFSKLLSYNQLSFSQQIAVNRIYDPVELILGFQEKLLVLTNSENVYLIEPIQNESTWQDQILHYQQVQYETRIFNGMVMDGISLYFIGIAVLLFGSRELTLDNYFQGDHSSQDLLQESQDLLHQDNSNQFQSQRVQFRRRPITKVLQSSSQTTYDLTEMKRNTRMKKLLRKHPQLHQDQAIDSILDRIVSNQQEVESHQNYLEAPRPRYTQFVPVQRKDLYIDPTFQTN